jgi:nucleoside-diphosphate-sugar epimerase
MVLGITRAMFEDSTKGEVINLGNPVEYSMIDMAQKIKQMTGSTSEIVHEPLPEDDPIKRKPDITKAVKLLGWKPGVDLEQGLQKTIEYYRSKLL